MLFKIVFFGIVAAGLSVLIRNYRPEIAMLLGTAAGAMLLLIVKDDLLAVVNISESFALNYGLNTKYIETALKIVGITCIGELGIQVCKDSGEGAVASKVEFCCKIVILSLTIPIMTELLSLATSLLA